MKEGWEYKKLIDVCDVYQPKTISTSKLVNNGPYYVYGANGIIGKYINFNHEESEVLLTCRGASCGNINVSKPKSWINGNAMVIHPLNEKITKEYLSYYLKVIDYSKVITGAAQPQITRSSLSDTFILYPSIDEQRRIVSYLDSSFKLIDEIKNKALKSLTEAKALFQSALAEAMEPKEGWEEKTLGELCSIIGGGTPSKKNSSYYNGDIPWATVSDMNCDYLQNTICKISDDGVKNSSTQIISKNEVIIATRVGLGKVCILCQDTAINQDLKGIIPKSDNKLIRKFIFWWFRSKSNYIVSNGVGATVKGVKLSFVSNLKISLPTISTQKQIVSHLDSLSSKVRAIEEKYQKMVEECDALKQAMLRDVFE